MPSRHHTVPTICTMLAFNTIGLGSGRSSGLGNYQSLHVSLQISVEPSKPENQLFKWLCIC